MNTLNHIAFIMDGNGRWGLKKKKNRNYGHLRGVDTVKKIVKASIKLNVPILTFYVFSSENWQRPQREISYLFKLISVYFKKEIDNISHQGIKINIIGRIEELPLSLKKILKKTQLKTKNNNKIIVNLALNYGSHHEIIDGIKKIKNKKKTIKIIDIEKNLELKKPYPDILIRTGGHYRLSNFLLWQLAYTEIFFIKKLWPDFLKSDLNKIIKKFYKIKRNFGKI